MHTLLTFLALFWTSAEAKPNINSFSSKLQDAGWTLNPFRGTTMTVGDIYRPEKQSPLIFGSDCFSLQPREGAYEGAEVVQILKAGLSLPMGVLNINTGAKKSLQQSFVAPYVSEVAELALNPNQSCSNAIQHSGAEDAFVVTAVLMAEVIEQECVDVDAGLGARIGGSAGFEKACTQESQGHVVVAYKSKAVKNLFNIAVEQKPVQSQCQFEQVYAERNIIIIDGEQYRLRKNRDESRLLHRLETCGYGEAASTYLLWRDRRSSAIRWGFSMIGTIYVAPWVALSANHTRKKLERQLLEPDA